MAAHAHRLGAMFGFFKKRRAIKGFVRDMGPELRKRYGRKSHYTPDEVKQTGRELRSNQDYFPYALCLFCSQADFNSQFPGAGNLPDYNALREEVGSSCFGGDTSFDANTAIEAASNTDTGWSGSGGDFGGDSGGDSGGGGGGD